LTLEGIERSTSRAGHFNPEKSLGARFSRGWVGLRRFFDLFKKKKEKKYFFTQLPGLQLLTFQPIINR